MDYLKIPSQREALIPLSHLELDVPAPVGGWNHYLAECGIQVLEDDIGRAAISRMDAKRLLAERREAEAATAQRNAS
jgi:hypothetical protein